MATITGNGLPDDVEFLEIIGWPGYVVGADGSVRSSYRRGKQTGIPKPYRPRVLVPDKDGYLTVCLCIARKRKLLHVAQLVMQAFGTPKPEGYEIAHFPDPSRTNNKKENLSWVTHSENLNHKKIHGTEAYGEKSYACKLSHEDVREIRRCYAAGESCPSIANRLKMSKTNIKGICAGQRRIHDGE